MKKTILLLALVAMFCDLFSVLTKEDTHLLFATAHGIMAAGLYLHALAHINDSHRSAIAGVASTANLLMFCHHMREIACMIDRRRGFLMADILD